MTFSSRLQVRIGMLSLYLHRSPTFPKHLVQERGAGGFRKRRQGQQGLGEGPARSALPCNCSFSSLSPLHLTPALQSFSNTPFTCHPPHTPPKHRECELLQLGACWSPACLISRVEREIILDCGILAARKSDFQYVRTFTDRCQLGLTPCTNQTKRKLI